MNTIDTLTQKMSLHNSILDNKKYEGMCPLNLNDSQNMHKKFISKSKSPISFKCLTAFENHNEYRLI